MKTSNGDKAIDILSDIKSITANTVEFVNATGLSSVNEIARKYF